MVPASVIAETFLEKAFQVKNKNKVMKSHDDIFKSIVFKPKSAVKPLRTIG